MEKIFQIPEGVNVDINGFRISVSGKKGKLEKDFTNPIFIKNIKIEKNGNQIKVSTDTDKKQIKAMVGTIAALMNSMSHGVTEGYTYTMKIVYMHFPFTVKVAGKEVVIANFLGGKAARKAKIIGETKVDVKGEDVIVSGISSEDVGQTCGNLEKATRIANRDRRVFQDGIFLFTRG